MNKIAVCIVNFNTRDFLRECLRSVIEENPEEIIVVDNASTDGSMEMVQEEFPAVKSLRLKGNLGYGAAGNRAIGNCQSEIVLLLNSDTTLTSGCLRALENHLDQYPAASLIGPRIRFPDGRPQTSTFYFPTPLHILMYLSGLYRFIHHVPKIRKRSLQKASTRSPQIVPWVLGAAIAFRRHVFDSVGGFDEDFFMYFEEVDLCYRLARSGHQIHYTPKAEIVHFGGASTLQQQKEMDVMYFNSLAQFYGKHYPQFQLVELVAMVKFFALIRLVRDTVRYMITRDEQKRSKLSSNLEVSKQLISGKWLKPVALESVITTQ